MGNTLVATHKIACGHTDNKHIRQSLLCDRLSQPTAEMAEALMALQGQTLLLQQFAERAPGTPPPTVGDLGERPVLLVAMAYCILLGYRCRSSGAEGSESSSPGGTPTRTAEPVQPAEFTEAFDRVLRRPQDFLQDLLSIRAQTVSREKLMRVVPLVKDCEGVTPDCFKGEYAQAMRPLVAFLHAAVECTEIYCEIRESAETGHFDKRQASQLLDGDDSDQRRMLSAMGGGGFEENELHDSYS